jgi:basic membrane lipoprotein Med (substrate-binding protein (PBP1-ABC) superfamily)
VIGHGSQYGSSIQEIAPDFPDTVFAWGTDVNTYGLSNVYAYTAAAEQGGYVNGVLAAMMTRSGQVGVTGPVEVGDAKTYIDGFVNGVNSTRPDVGVSQSWTQSFSDVAAMTAAASTHIANGADALTGSSQSPELVVASQVYDWTGMLREIIANRETGELGGQAYVLTFANDGLKMAFNPQVDIPADAMEAAEAAIEGIKSGEIQAQP